MATTGIGASAYDRARAVAALRRSFVGELRRRLAAERRRWRMYDALAAKSVAAGPTPEELKRFRDDELRHVEVLRTALRAQGDRRRNAPLPAEDAAIVRMLADPRTSLSDALNALLIAEIADVDAWELLTSMARDLGLDAFEHPFRRAAMDEQVHLFHVRLWVIELGVTELGIHAAR